MEFIDFTNRDFWTGELPRKEETIDWNFCELRILKFTI